MKILEFIMKRVILLLCVMSLFGSLYAQINPANIKVDDLTDAQIEQYVKRAELMGYGESQLDGFARAQGVSAVETQKYRDQRY